MPLCFFSVSRPRHFYGHFTLFSRLLENICPQGTSYSINGVSSNGLSRGGHSVKSPDPYSVLISLSVYRSTDRGPCQKVNYKPSCNSSASSARVVIDSYCASCWRSPAGAYLPSHPGDAHRTPSVRPYFLTFGRLSADFQ